jgi:hypothetical protein
MPDQRMATGLPQFRFQLGDGRWIIVVWTPNGLDVTCNGELLPMEPDAHIPVPDRGVS